MDIITLLEIFTWFGIYCFALVCLLMPSLSEKTKDRARAIRTNIASMVLIILGFIFEFIDPLGLVILLGIMVPFIITTWPSTRSSSKVLDTHSFSSPQKSAYLKRGFAVMSVSIVSLSLAVHLIPGFHNPTLFGPLLLPGSSLEFTLNANIDKAFAAIMLLTLFAYKLKTLNRDWPNKRELDLIVTGIGMVVLIALMMGLQPAFKPVEYVWQFLIFNLIVTCVAEEAFFRLCIQDGLNRMLFKSNQTAPSSMRRYLPSRHSAIVLTTALVFMLAHFHTGEGATERLLLIFFAGLLYASIYQIRRNLIAAILVHSLMNATHFIFFSYPASFSN